MDASQRYQQDANHLFSIGVPLIAYSAVLNNQRSKILRIIGIVSGTLGTYYILTGCTTAYIAHFCENEIDRSLYYGCKYVEHAGEKVLYNAISQVFKKCLKICNMYAMGEMCT